MRNNGKRKSAGLEEPSVRLEPTRLAAQQNLMDAILRLVEILNQYLWNSLLLVAFFCFRLQSPHLLPLRGLPALA